MNKLLPSLACFVFLVGLSGSVQSIEDLSQWAYKQGLVIDNTANPNTLTDYQVKVEFEGSSLIAQGKLNSDCSDLRFSDVNNNSLSYWLESCPSTAWVKVPSIPASSKTTIYMYYGNPSASSESDGDAVFEFFDDFSGGSLDTSKWEDLSQDSGSATIVNGRLRLDSPSGNYNTGQVRTKMNFTGDIALEHKWWLITWPHCGDYGTVDNNRAYTYLVAAAGNFVRIARLRNHYCSGSWLNHYDFVSTGLYVNGSSQGGYSAQLLDGNGEPKNTVVYPEGRYKIVRHGTNVLAYYDDTLLGNWTNGFLDDSRILFIVYGSFRYPPTTVDYDDVFVRKYADPEPTVTLQDSDSDSIPDYLDNCPTTPNPDQQDMDVDGVGDVCDNCIEDRNSDQADSDGDGSGDLCDNCPDDPENDADVDGVCGNVDICADTAIPEATVPSIKLGVNRFALIDSDNIFDTVSPKGKGPRKSFTIDDTMGCSCEQILASIPDEQMGHVKFGCSISIIEEWKAPGS